MNPYLNFVIGKPMNELGEVMMYLYNNPSVYFKPMNKVMPSKFFMNWAWMSKTSFLKHIERGNFAPVKNRKDVMRERIRQALSDCPKFDSKLKKDRVGYYERISLVSDGSEWKIVN